MAEGEAFHVSITQAPHGGGNPLEVGARLELQPPSAVYVPDAEAEIAGIFAAGLTAHGKQYMADAPPDQGSWPGWTAELFFEAVRLAWFPDHLSRMQSVFGFSSVADARAFVGGYRAGRPCAIYRVRGEVAHRANMPLLQSVGLPGSVAFNLARCYWLGERGPRPELWELLMRPPVEIIELVEPVVK